VREYLDGSWGSPENRWEEIEVWGTRTTQLAGNYYEWNTQAGTATSYYYADQSRVAVRRGGVLYCVADAGGAALTAPGILPLWTWQRRFLGWISVRYGELLF
jgi:hypothetical protein